LMSSPQFLCPCFSLYEYKIQVLIYHNHIPSFTLV
jgi:hypothetical protein